MTAEILYDFPAAALLLFILIPLIWGLASLHAHRVKVAENYSKASALVMIPRDQASEWIKGLLLALTWTCAVIAFMQPKGNSHYAHETVKASYQESFSPLNQIQLILDASASMQVEDVRDKQARFAYAKEVLDEMIRVWNGKTGSLWAFTETATKVSPATMDALFLRLMLRDMNINEGNSTGTKLLSTVEAIKSEMEKLAKDKHLTTVILSDGEDTSQGTDQAKHSAIQNALNELSQKYKNRLAIFTVGIGSKAGGTVPQLMYQGHPVQSKRDDQFLEQISQVGGEFLLDDNRSSISLAHEIVEKVNKTEIKDWSENTASHEEPYNPLIYTAYYQYPLALALLLLLLEMLTPMVSKSRKEAAL